MPFKVYATKDEIPSDQQGTALALADGKFAVDEPEDTSALTTAIEAERGKREAAEKLVKKQAADLAKADREKKAASHGLTDEQLQAIRAEASADLEKKLADKETELETERTANKSRIKAGEFKTLAADQKFVGKKLDDLFRLHGDEFDLTDDGKLMVKGKPGIDPKKHMETIAATRGEWVEGTKAAGGGAAGQTGSAATGTLTAEDILANPARAFG
jgi:hypothetical protein